MRIEQVVAELRAAAERLATEHPDLAADERAWLDTLSGECDGLDVAEWLAERCLHLSAMEDAATERAKSLQARAKRFAADQDRLKGMILSLVDAAGGKKVVRATMTLSPRNLPPKLVANDAALTPAEMLTAVTTMVPNKDAIREALDLGAEVPGWHMTNGSRSLSILTR